MWPADDAVMRFIKGFVDFIRESFIKQPENTLPGGRKRIVFIDLAKGVCIILVVLLFAAVAAVTYCVLNGTPFIDFRSNVYQGNIAEIYLVAVVLVIALLLICKAVEWLPLVSYIGRYSVIVLCCHAIFIDYAYLPYYFCVGRDVTALESVVISWILCWLCIPVLKTFMPYITAQKDLITYTPSDSGRIGSKQFRKA